MSDKAKEKIFKDLGIDPESEIDIPEAMKKIMIAKINEEIGMSLSMGKILRSGIEYACCDVFEIEKDRVLEGVTDQMRSNRNFKHIPELVDNAELCFAGSITRDSANEKEADYFVILTDDARMGIFTWKEGVTQEKVTGLIHYLLRTGFEAHDLINRVYFKDNFDLPDHVIIHATGAAVDVLITKDGGYRVNVEMPDDMFPVIGREIGERLKNSMSGIQVSEDRLCENPDKKDCDCPACQFGAIARSRLAKDNGEVH